MVFKAKRLVPLLRVNSSPEHYLLKFSSQNDEMLPCSLSKTHPQLAAKLLQPKVLGVTEEASTSAVQQNEKILKENVRIYNN